MACSLGSSEFKVEAISDDEEFICMNATREPADQITKPVKMLPPCQPDVFSNSWNMIIWNCFFCKQLLKDFSTFSAHLETLHKVNDIGQTNYRCNDCNVALLGYASFLNHVRKTHYENLKLCCDACNEIFPDYSKLSLHRDQHIGGINSAYPTVYNCTLCEDVHSTEKELKSHIQLKHNASTPEENNRDIFTDASADTSQLSIQCKEEINDTETIFQCGKCVKSFQTEKELEVHVGIHTGEQLNQCEVCDKQFAEMSNLKEHMRRHIKDRPYKCDYCTKSFSYSSSLNNHMRIHTGDHPYKCEICLKTFSSQNSLRRHLNTHDADYPLKCRICSECLSDYTAIEKHMYTHNKDYPFKCKICSKGFSDYTTIKIHVKVHHAGGSFYKCEICARTFSTKSYLTFHQNNVCRKKLQIIVVMGKNSEKND